MNLRRGALGRWVHTALVLGLAGALAFAQPAATTQPPVELNAEHIKAAEARIQERTDLDDATKTAILERHREALESLRLADEWSRKAAQFEEERGDAPVRLERIRRELAQPRSEARAEPPPGASLQQLEQSMAQAEAEVKAARDEAAALDAERKRRTDRRTEIPKATVTVKQRLEQIDRELAASPSQDELPELTMAKHGARQALKQALQSERDAYDREIASYDARGELLTARRDLAARTASGAEALVQAWQAIVGERRRAETEAAAREAERTRRAAARSHPVVARLAEKNAVWAAKRTDARLADRIEQATRDLDEATRRAADWAAQYSSVTSKVRAAGLTHAMGLLLRRQRDSLPDAGKYRRAIGQRQSDISAVQIELIDVEDHRSELADLDDLIQASLRDVGEVAGPTQRQDLELAIRELWTTRRDLVDALANDYDSYFRKLVDLDNAERHLIAQIEVFQDYIDEHILWIRSGAPPSATDVTEAGQALRWLTAPANWSSAAAAFWLGLGASAIPSGLLLVLIAVLLGVRRRLCTRIESLGATAARPSCCNVMPTVAAASLTVLVAASWPILIWWIGWSTASRLDSPDFARAAGGGLRVIGVAFLAIEILRQVFRPHGLAEAHFGWSRRGSRKLRRTLIPLLVGGLPTLFVVAVMESTQSEEWQNSLGRAAFVLGQLVVGYVAFQALHPKHAILRDRIAASPDGWLARSKWVWFVAGVGSPVVLIGLALAGYTYTALRVSGRLGSSVCLVLVVLIVYGFVLRFILVSRRRLAMDQARARKQEKEGAGGERDGRAAGAPAPEPDVQLTTIDVQSRRLLRTISIVGVAAGLWLVWADVIPALGLLDRVTLWSTTTTVYEQVTGPDGAVVVQPRAAAAAVSLADLGLTVVILLVTFMAAKNLPGLLEMLLLRRLPLGAGERYAVATVTRYVVTIVGLVLAFQAVGVSWSKVQWLVAAITVGLGFGLQEIFANFVSGLILLFERPIRIGDTVTVGDTEGTVSRIQMRATTVTDWNRKEIVIPNKEFVTGRIINWSLSDQIIRLIIRVGIAYGSDTRRARELLLDVAHRDPHVLAAPRPKALFMEFGDSSLNFELRAFVKDIDDFLVARHGLHTAIDDAFREAGVEIAFPQRDVHVRSIKDALRVEEPRRERE